MKINDINIHLKKLEKEQQIKLKENRKKKIITIKAKINERERKLTIEKINKVQNWFFKKANKIDKCQARSMGIEKIIIEHYKQLYANRI